MRNERESWGDICEILSPGFSTEEKQILCIMEKWCVLGCGTVKWIMWKGKIIAARYYQTDNLIIKRFLSDVCRKTILSSKSIEILLYWLKRH